MFDGIDASKEKYSFFSIHLYYLYKNKRGVFISALTDWANGMHYKKWIAKYPASQREINNTLYINKAGWVTKNNIQRTPMIFLNNKEFPEMYQLSDLEVLLMNEDIIDIITGK